MAFSIDDLASVANVLGVAPETLKTKRGRKAGTLSEATKAARALIEAAKPNDRGIFIVHGVTASQVTSWARDNGRTFTDRPTSHARFGGACVYRLAPKSTGKK